MVPRAMIMRSFPSLTTSASQQEVLCIRVQRNTHASSSRISNRSRSGMPESGEKHVPQLILILRNHISHIGKTPEIRHIKMTVVGLAILSHKSSSVDAEDHRKIERQTS